MVLLLALVQNDLWKLTKISAAAAAFFLAETNHDQSEGSTLGVETSLIIQALMSH